MLPILTNIWILSIVGYNVKLKSRTMVCFDVMLFPNLDSNNQGFNKGSSKILKVLRRLSGSLALKMNQGTSLVGGGSCRNLTAQLRFEFERTAGARVVPRMIYIHIVLQ
jgi:hypothetical protein